MEQYQDIWVKGKLEKPGIRETESRYKLIKSVAEKYKRPFTVLDIGANLGYFAIRLTEDFPECTVVALEDAYSDWLTEVLDKNETERVILLKKKATLEDLKYLADIEHFDIVLAMSVIHHIDGGFKNVLEACRNLGDNLIAETATEDRACGQKSVKESFIPEDAEILGYGKSHLKGPKRPVFWLQQQRKTLKKRYYNSPRKDALDLTIESTFTKKIKKQRGKELDWVRGINLMTYINFGGRRPKNTKIREILKANKPTDPHGDLSTHNVILKGDGIEFIDWNDEKVKGLNDDKQFEKILIELRVVN